MVKTPSNQKQELIQSLVKNAEVMIQAGMSQTRRTCGKRACACHEDPSKRHGPNTYLSFRNAKGKSSGMYEAPAHLAEAVEAKKAWDQFWEIATTLATLNREELKRNWQAAGKARTE